MDQFNAFSGSFNFDSQVELNDSVKNFSDHLCSIMSPFFEVKGNIQSGNSQERSNFEKEDKPWFNHECKQLYKNYMRCLKIFNHNKCVANHNDLIVAKRKYKICEARLKRRYKRQEGNMLEGLKLMNPKLFYRKFSSKRRIKPRVSVDEFF